MTTTRTATAIDAAAALAASLEAQATSLKAQAVVALRAARAAERDAKAAAKDANALAFRAIGLGESVVVDNGDGTETQATAVAPCDRSFDLEAAAQLLGAEGLAKLLKAPAIDPAKWDAAVTLGEVSAEAAAAVVGHKAPKPNVVLTDRKVEEA
jgi:hypothetical protein